MGFVSNNKFGEALRLFRTKKKLSQRDLGAMMGMSNTIIHNYERGILIPRDRLEQLLDIIKDDHESVELLTTAYNDTLQGSTSARMMSMPEKCSKNAFITYVLDCNLPDDDYTIVRSIMERFKNGRG